MKYLFSILLCIASLFAFSQNVASDSTYSVVEGGKTFQVDVTNYANGAQDLKKREVTDLSGDLNSRILAKADRWTDFYNRLDNLDEKIQKFIRENNRIATQTGVNLLDSNQVAMQGSLVGTYAVLDYDRSNSMDFAVNGNGNLRYSGIGTGQVICLTPTVIYLRNWRTNGLLLFTSDGGATWTSVHRKIILTKQ